MSHPPQIHRILIVEDDTDLAEMIRDFLMPQGFDVSIETDGETAVTRIIRENPDAVVLDISLPGRHGFSVCRAVRPQYRGSIVMLTARGDELDEVLGFEAGADDYMAKPVRPHALLVRLRTHLRRVSPAEQATPPVKVGALVIDPARRAVKLDSAELDLTTAEFDLLHLLASNAGQILSRNEIYQHIHGMKYDGVDRSIDLRISRLRKKVGDDPAKPHCIKSVRGVGYIMSVEP